jgi:hypothetical protein
MEPRFAIKYFLEEKKMSLEILDLMQKRDKEDGSSQSQVYYRMAEIRRERTDLSDPSRPGRTPDDDIPDAVRHKFQEDLKASARKVARILSTSCTTVRRCQKKDSGMKYLHRKWVHLWLIKSQQDHKREGHA